jgi:hypothetical protein
MDAPPPAPLAKDPALMLLWQRQEFLARQQQELLTRVTALERGPRPPVA